MNFNFIGFMGEVDGIGMVGGMVDGGGDGSGFVGGSGSFSV
jgi:hypothetical protein